MAFAVFRHRVSQGVFRILCYSLAKKAALQMVVTRRMALHVKAKHNSALFPLRCSLCDVCRGAMSERGVRVEKPETARLQGTSRSQSSRVVSAFRLLLRTSFSHIAIAIATATPPMPVPVPVPVPVSLINQQRRRATPCALTTGVYNTIARLHTK